MLKYARFVVKICIPRYDQKIITIIISNISNIIITYFSMAVIYFTERLVFRNNKNIAGSFVLHQTKISPTFDKRARRLFELAALLGEAWETLLETLLGKA